MTWNDFHRRQHAIKAVLERARNRPDERPTADGTPEARAVFEGTDELLSALQYTWTQALIGRVDTALAEAESTRDGDRLEAVKTAWRRAATANPVLRRILDEHVTEPAAELRRGFEREHRMLALSSGLADHDESPPEITRAGSAFLRLLRTPASSGDGTPGPPPRLLPSN